MISIGVLWINTESPKSTEDLTTPIEQILTTNQIMFLSKQGNYFARKRFCYIIK